jgi:hypothetical protein
MEEGSSCNKLPLRIREAEPLGSNVRKVHCPQRMFKPRMVCTGVHKVGKPQLPDVPEPLQCRGVKECTGKIIQFDIAMHRVFDDLFGIH